MAFHPFDEEEVYPPFAGYPREGVAFLRNLKRHNNRPWFEKHRDQYENDVKLPMLSLIAALRPDFQRFGPEFDLNPKRCLFRIYRDVRFSKDKRPYKTHVAAHFVLRGRPKGVGGSGYYLHIEPGEVFLGGGIYMPDGDQLKKIRRGLIARSDEFLGIIQDRQFRKLFGNLEGERLSRIPQGFPPDHPMGEWLRLKQFFVGLGWKEERCYSPKFASAAAAVFETASPLVRFVNSLIT